MAALVGNAFLQAAAAAAVGLLLTREISGEGVALAGATSPVGTIALAAAALLLVGAGRLAERFFSERLGQSYIVTLRRNLLRHLLRLELPRGRRAGEGAILVRFAGDISAQKNWIGRGLPRAVSGAIMIGGAGLLLTSLEPALGLMFLLFCVLGIALNALNQGPLVEVTRDMRRRRGRLVGRVARAFRELKAYQHMGAEGRMVSRLDRMSEGVARASVRQATAAGRGQALSETVASAIPFALISAGSVLGLASPAATMSALAVAAIVMPRIRELGRVHEYAVAAAVSRSHLTGFLRRPQLPRRQRKPVLSAPAGRVTCRGVACRPVLNRVDLDVEPGERLAITGPNGAGKSTVLMLLAGLLRPSAGRIEIDGQSLGDARTRSIGRRVSLVSSEVPPVAGSLRRNLTLGLDDDEIDDEKLHRIARDFGLDRLSGWGELGLDLPILECGRNLSSGERDLLCLARAIVREPGVLLLDESGAHLDAVARRIYARTIRGFAGTVIMTSHDPELLGLCTRRAELVDGLLREPGPQPTDIQSQENRR